METVKDWMIRIRRRAIEKGPEFKSIFGVFIMNYCDFTGFNVIKFDEWFLKTPDGISCSDEVERRYGSRAVALIRELIATERR